MLPNKVITLTDGSKIYVPDSLDLLSSYVLEEQLDWFEDELNLLEI